MTDPTDYFEAATFDAYMHASGLLHLSWHRRRDPEMRALVRQVIRTLRVLKDMIAARLNSYSDLVAADFLAMVKKDFPELRGYVIGDRLAVKREGAGNAITYWDTTYDPMTGETIINVTLPSGHVRSTMSRWSSFRSAAVHVKSVIRQHLLDHRTRPTKPALLN